VEIILCILVSEKVIHIGQGNLQRQNLHNCWISYNALHGAVKSVQFRHVNALLGHMHDTYPRGVKVFEGLIAIVTQRKGKTLQIGVKWLNVVLDPSCSYSKGYIRFITIWINLFSYVSHLFS